MPRYQLEVEYTMQNRKGEARVAESFVVYADDEAKARQFTQDAYEGEKDVKITKVDLI